MYRMGRSFAGRAANALALAFVIGAQTASAAEISCVERDYYARPPHTEERLAAVPMERWKARWPGGYRPTMQSCQTAFLSGVIERGDYERFRAFYAKHWGTLDTLYLWSAGGDAEEAMQIGRLVRNRLVEVLAPDEIYQRELKHLRPGPGKAVERYVTLCSGPTCVCASACALIWFGAVERTGRVGLHRPRITDARYKALGPTEASAVYKKVLLEISKYLEDMEAPRPLIDAMVGTSSSDIHWVDTFDDQQLEHPPSFVEWVDASCGSFSAQERKILDDLTLPSSRWDKPPLTEQEVMLRGMLWQKSGARRTCAAKLVDDRRRGLPAP